MLEWCTRRWRMWIRPVVMIIYGIIILVLLPLCIWRLTENGVTSHDQAWFIGGIFVLMALPITFWEITQHLVHYTKPYMQKYIIRILWMVPIYALNAWLVLTSPKIGIYLDTCRECYEAYVIYNFMVFLLNFLRYEMELDITVEDKPSVKHIFPCCCLKPCPGGRDFIHACKHGILQYTVMRPLTTITSLICELSGVYGEGKFVPNVAYPYIVVINNISQFVAMYSLVLFYKAYKKQLSPMKPVAKFLCIKAVVFFSFFQSVIISILVYTGVIHQSFTSGKEHDVGEIGRSLQDFIICIEMFLAAVAHYFAFSHRPFVDLAAAQAPCCASFLSMWDVSDVTHDVSEHIRHVGNKVKRTVSGKKSSEHQRLLAPEAEGSGSSTYHSVGTSDGPWEPEPEDLSTDQYDLERPV
ncbi:transmembrane protein 184C-like [Centruroides sculpturatus]|uniref:transmembrane protein 184C-like n=1 Tax=Centruroides sculpturatus TaxID=218467 RepID=UPI000C6EF387|nr:transmembrane protein 184C-like [Centruroides sculpturatus]XP_023234330.1 transmembrane protein 184C-like [Centruroides sculpturatus]XP_023234331.1 transmembrane protein 184C-like [Centruroides sculpturatus]XP_023234332.1 transmembrane protein 184C-like [Centruroides sculpturatus]